MSRKMAPVLGFEPRLNSFGDCRAAVTLHWYLVPPPGIEPR